MRQRALLRRRPGRRARAAAVGLGIIWLVGCTDSGPDPELALASTTSTTSSVAGGQALEVVVDPADGSSADSGTQTPTVDGQGDGAVTPASGEPPPSGQAQLVLVVAGASDPYDRLLTDMMAQMDGLGVEGRISNCDQGAAEALGMAAEGTFTLSAPIDSQAAVADALAVLSADGIDAVPAEVVVACPN